MPPKCKLNTCTLEKKAEILRRHIFDKEKIHLLATEYGVPRNTISTWKKQAETIFQEAAGVQPARKRLRKSPYLDIEIALLYWLKDMRSRDYQVPLSKDFMTTKAEW